VFDKGSRGSLGYTPSTNTSDKAITDELATLMTAGRLPAESRQVINRVIGSEPDPLMKVIKAQQLISFTPEFHTTSISKKSGEKRSMPPKKPPSTKPYKAVVYLQLQGAFDSFNMLVPHTCTTKNAEGQTVREQYHAERTSLALNDNERSRIINATGQPCSEFVVHPNLEIVEKLYKDGDLSFFANMGVLNRPVTKDNYIFKTVTNLFAHNDMQLEGQRIDPFDTTSNTGILGRMCDALVSGGFNPQPITIENSAVATEGFPGAGVTPLIVSPSANSVFGTKPQKEAFDVRPFVDELNEATEVQSSLFGETWSKTLQQGLSDNKDLVDALSTSQVQTQFPTGNDADKFKKISSLVASRDSRGKDRDVFFAAIGGWDHHSAMKSNLASRFKDLNATLTAFVDEMKAQGVWDNVALVITSDFARTLTANSGDGSDHAWGGNYFIMGGAVKGGQIHGNYPDDMTANGPVNIGRGRLIPTLSWESMMNSVVDWMGVDSEQQLDYCMPNRKQTGTKLFAANEVFNVV